ncbi:MAG: sigma 54-interacting transcriptional regulator [Planctomycetota bacterium]|jgi:propionate catabolism operon transcriptional regulator|nr:sigma 54-interacting transcriptional regulator [Planctomycetota bacterium]
MIKVTVIAPYAELMDLAEESLRATIRQGVTYEVIHAYGTRLDDLAFGSSDVVLARGLTRQSLARKCTEAAILELPVSPYDIVRAVRDTLRVGGAGRIAVIAADSVLHDVEALMEIVDTDLRVFRIRDEPGILAALEAAERDGCEAMIGGLTAYTIAKSRGWRAAFIRTSAETIQVAIKEAVNTAAVLHAERTKAEISRTILNNAGEGILYFDREGALSLFNPRAREILNLPARTGLAGRRAEELFSDPEILEPIRNCREKLGLIRDVNLTAVVCDFTPVLVAGQAVGIICTFQRAHEIQAAASRIRKELHRKGLVAKYSFGDIVHVSATMREAIATAGKYAAADANILLTGETGTGKELFAQSIHNASPRRARPFVAVNCAAFPKNLLESELFGYVDGAFSGAARGGRTGLFELAHGGTLFLDEIGEIPSNLQASLLRALQEGEIRRIGDDRMIPVDVRIIAAANRDLRENPIGGRFRRDLLYRLDVLSLDIPSLRERAEDIRPLADHYVALYCRKYGKSRFELPPEAVLAMNRHSWPGNVRELRNVCERLAILADSASPSDMRKLEKALRFSANESPAPGEREGETPGPVPGRNVEDLIRLTDSLRVNKTELAKMLGISRTTLWRKAKKRQA